MAGAGAGVGADVSDFTATSSSSLKLLELNPLKSKPDIFMHDSDHSFTHMIMEVSLVWAHMEKGLVIADNVEQNDAFQVFARATDAPYLVVSSFDEPTRKWLHGLLVKGL